MPAESSSAHRSSEIELATFAAELPYGGIPAGAKAAFDRLALDFVSVVIAGLGDPACIRAANAFGGLSEFGASTSASAFALAVCAHWFDWDDTDDTSHVHGGAVMFSALLAARSWIPSAQHGHLPGEFVAATVAGYDIACRVGSHLRNHGHRGWMPTGSGGTVGAAAAAARLAGCDAREIRSVMGIAAANAGISRQALADRTSSKGVLAGIAAKTAVDSLSLARSGIEGARHFLAGAYGLCALEGNGTQMGAATDLGSNFLIEGVSVKPYPCCRSAHAVIDSVLEFQRDSPGAAANIAAMHVSAPPGVFERCGAPFHIGKNARLSAQFSIPYTATLALRKGRVELEDFEEARIVRNSAQWKDLIEAVHVHRNPKSTSDVLAPIHLQLVSGGDIIAEREIKSLKGDPENPLSEAEQSEKLRSAARGLLSEGEVSEVEMLVRNVQYSGPHELIQWLHPRLAKRARSVTA